MGRGGAACTARRAASGAKMATVTMSLCAWKHSYELFLSCDKDDAACDHIAGSPGLQKVSPRKRMHDDYHKYRYINA